MLKYSFILLLLPFILVASPQWYNTPIYYSHGSVYYGYGEGETQQDAKNSAAAEISEQIITTISSRTNIASSLKNNIYQNSVKNSIISSSSTTLKEMHIVKKSIQNGRYYLLLEYLYTTPLWFEQRKVDAPLFSKIGYGIGNDPSEANNNAIKDLKVQGTLIHKEKLLTVKSDKIGKKYFHAVAQQDIPQLPCDEPQNPFMAESRLIQNANKLTPCSYNYTLQHMNSRWYLHYKSLRFPLSRADFDAFFINMPNTRLELSSSKTTFQEGDGFNIKINTFANAYLSLFTVYEDGRVGVLFANKKVKEDAQFYFPSLQGKEEFVAALMTPGKATKDLYIGVLSGHKLNLSPFEQQQSKFLSDNAFKFNEVIALCSVYDCSTLVLKTDPQ